MDSFGEGLHFSTGASAVTGLSMALRTKWWAKINVIQFACSHNLKIRLIPLPLHQQIYFEMD